MRRLGASVGGGLVALGLAGCGADLVPPDTASELSVQELNAGVVAVGARVTLRGVVVTFRAGLVGNVYVQAPEGGPSSATMVHLQDEQLDLAPGDLVDVVNAYVEDGYLSCLAPGTGACASDVLVRKVATGDAPSPEPLDPTVLAADADEAARWRHALAVFEDVRVTGAPYAEQQDCCDEWGTVAVPITGPFIWQLDEVLVDQPPPASIVYPACVASVTGVIGRYASPRDLDPNPAAYEIMSRSDEDVGGEGAGCPPLEEGVACADGVDNDRGGYVDCDDPGCATACGG